MSSSGTFSHIKFGDGLTVTDEGTETIRVDAGGGGGAATATPVFVQSGGYHQIHNDDVPAIIDDSTLGASMHFYTNDDATFDNSSGRARFLVPGMYVIGCQFFVRPNEDFDMDVYASLALQYEDSVGYSIEVPYLYSGLLDGGGEQVMGTRFVYPSGTGNSYDICLQRLHPISLTDASTFPLEIRPTFVHNWFHSTAIIPVFVATWGWRIGDALGAYHSD